LFLSIRQPLCTSSASSKSSLALSSSPALRNSAHISSWFGSSVSQSISSRRVCSMTSPSATSKLPSALSLFRSSPPPAKRAFKFPRCLPGKRQIKSEDGMRKLAATLVLFGLSALPALGASETFKNVSVVDVNCSKKVADNPDVHTRDCALQCAMSGFGMLTADKKFVKFDDAGNAKVKEALQVSKQKDHLRADVTGEMQGETLKVTSIKLP